MIDDVPHGSREGLQKVQGAYRTAESETGHGPGGESDETRKKLMRLKLEEDKASVDEVLEDLLAEHKKHRFREAPDPFRRRLRNKDVDIGDPLE